MNPIDAPVRDWAAELGLPADVGILARLMRLQLLVQRVLDDIAGDAGVSASDYLVLAVVRRSPAQRATPGRICEILDRTSGGMSLALDRLEKAGWLRRSADPADRRRVVVELTPEGLAVATRVNADLHAWEESLDLSPAQQRDTARVVDRLLTLFESHPSAP
ncbi:MAG: winged helix DNA-binding protein [Acidimicrobiales bacterium]|nr:winged helix DNA-binding protein [Acidimicrobiales bacterium]